MQIDDGERNDPSWRELFDFVHDEHGIVSNPTLVVAVVRAALTRWGRPTIPQALYRQGEELAELAAMLRREAHWMRVEAKAPIFAEPADRIDRAAALLEQLSDLAADAVAGLRYIEGTHGRLYGVGWDRVYSKADALKPHLFKH